MQRRSTLDKTNKYVNILSEDLSRVHAKVSPLESFKGVYSVSIQPAIRERNRIIMSQRNKDDSQTEELDWYGATVFASSSSLRLRIVGMILTMAAIVIPLLLVGYLWSRPATHDEKNEFMKLAAQVAAGVVVVIGLQLTAYSLRVSQHNTRLTQRTVENASRQQQIDRETKVAELFYKASEQLSMDSVHRRVAGIHTLARIAEKHDDYYKQFVEVLVAYINTHELGNDQTSLQAAVDALCNRKHCYLEGEEQPIRFSQVDFSGIAFRSGDFCNATFSECSFKGASFIETRFNFTDFLFCDLSGFTWDGSDFRGADFFNTNCRMLGSFPTFDQVPVFKTKRLMRVGEGKSVSFTRVLDHWMATTKRSELLSIPDKGHNKGVVETFEFIRKRQLVEEGEMTEEEFEKHMAGKMVSALDIE